VSLLAVLIGVALLYTGMFVGRTYLDEAFGLYIEIGALTDREFAVLGSVVVSGTLVGLAPALRAYRMSLADGMQTKV